MTTWVKISKVMPQPKSISPGKGREALRQKFPIFHLQIWYGLTVHTRFYIYKHNFSKFCLSVKVTVNYTKFAQFAPNTPHYLLVHCVSDTCLGRKFSLIPANYANSAQFAHIVCKLCEIRTNC